MLPYRSTVEQLHTENFQGGPAATLDGVSKFNYNAGAYFEKNGFSIRDSYNFRSSYSGSSGIFGDGDITPADDQLDGPISYQISKAISISADVNNLLDAVQKTENSFGLLKTYNLIGCRITAGVHVSFWRPSNRRRDDLDYEPPRRLGPDGIVGKYGRTGPRRSKRTAGIIPRRCRSLHA